MEGLGDLPGGSFFSLAADVSDDGSVIVGLSSSDSDNEAFRWNALDGMVGLDDLPGGRSWSIAQAVSGNGAIIVGRGTSTAGREAAVWSSDGGVHSLWGLLVAQGADPAIDGWSALSNAVAVSDDGKRIAGYGTRNGNTEAFVALIPEPTAIGLAAFAGVFAVGVRRHCGNPKIRAV